jgi:gluconolactonase
MKTILGTLLLTFALLPSANSAPASLLAKGAKVQKLHGGFSFTEGPAWDGEESLYFTDIPNERIHIWKDGKLSTFREKSGRANGLYFDLDGNLLMCEGGARQVTRSDANGKITVVAKSWNGKRLNSPNDLWVTPDGGIYFTDPRYGRDPNMEIDGFHVYFIAPGSSKVTRILDNLVKPNGIIGTKDSKTLYVADPGAKKTYSYRIGDDGSLSNRKLAADSGSDGMTLDAKGNLYLTSDSVKVYSPKAKLIADIKIPERPSNVTFGGTDGRTLFITARKSLYSVRMAVTGQ